MRQYVERYAQWMVVLCYIVGIFVSHTNPSWVGSMIGLASVISFAYMYVKGSTNTAIRWQEHKALLIPYMVAILLMVPSIFVATDTAHSMSRWFSIWILNWLACIGILSTIEERRCVYLLLAALGGYYISENIYSMYQLVHVIPKDWPDVIRRSYGFYGSYHRALLYGTFIAMMIPTSFIIMCSEAFPSWLRRIFSLSMVSSLIGLGTNKSRSTWLVAIPSIVYPIYAHRKIWRRYVAALLILCTVLGGIFVSSTHYMERLKSSFNTTTDGSNLGRIQVWEGTMKIVETYPLVGIGVGEFGTYYLDYRYRMEEEVQRLPHSHNNFLQELS